MMTNTMAARFGKDYERMIKDPLWRVYGYAPTAQTKLAYIKRCFENAIAINRVSSLSVQQDIADEYTAWLETL